MILGMRHCYVELERAKFLVSKDLRAQLHINRCATLIE